MAKKTAKKSTSKKKVSRTHSVDDARNEIIAETVLGEMMNVTIVTRTQSHHIQQACN